jgi:hypothetical protein
VKKICPTDDADNLVSPDDGKPLDALLLHQPHDFLQLGVFRGHLRLNSHDLADFAAMHMDVFTRQASRANEKLEPARPPAFGAGFPAAQQVPSVTMPTSLPA